MNFFKTRRSASKNSLNFNSTTKLYPECECEDLPNNIRASKIILRLPFDPPKKSASSPYLGIGHLPRQPRLQNPIHSISEIDNRVVYKPPVYFGTSNQSLSSLGVLPHRYGVECNDLHRIRTRIKNRPKLRRLVINLKK
jgi:hypothetical protein